MDRSIALGHVGGDGGRPGRRRRGDRDSRRGGARAKCSAARSRSSIKPERLKQLAATEAAAVVMPGEHCDCRFGPARCAIRVKDVHAAFAKIVSYFRPPRMQVVDRRQPAGDRRPHGSAGQKRERPSRRDDRRRLLDRRRHHDSARRPDSARLRDRPRRADRPRRRALRKHGRRRPRRSSTAAR